MRHPLSPALILLLALSAHGLPAQDRILDDQYDYGFTPLPDVDKDGFTDYVQWRPTSVTIYSGFSRMPIRTLANTGSCDYPSFCRCATGDLDGDGKPELLVTNPQEHPSGLSGTRGSVRIYDPVTGKLLREHWGPFPGMTLGDAILVVGDVDQDGCEDYLVGDTNAPGYSSGRGAAYLFSGKNGYQIRLHTRLDVGYFGARLFLLGDLDQDGLRDYVVTDGSTNYEIYSAKTGKSLLFSTGIKSGSNGCLAPIGDQDQDGVEDYAASEGRRTINLYSGKTRSLIKSLSYALPTGYVTGLDVISMDIDSDGHRDLLLVEPWDESTMLAGYGRIRIISGKDWKEIAFVEGTAARPILATRIGAAGDADNDGRTDFWIGGGKKAGTSVYQGDLRAMRISNGWISLYAGGTRTLRIRAGQAHAKKLYLVLGSTTGTSPGTTFGNVVLPLTLDPYMAFTAANPNTLIQASLGVLGIDGEADARFVLPWNQSSAYTGIRLHHATLVMGLVPFSFDYATNAVPLLLGY